MPRLIILSRPVLLSRVFTPDAQAGMDDVVKSPLQLGQSIGSEGWFY